MRLVQSGVHCSGIFEGTYRLNRIITQSLYSQNYILIDFILVIDCIVGLKINSEEIQKVTGNIFCTFFEDFSAPGLYLPEQPKNSRVIFNNLSDKCAKYDCLKLYQEISTKPTNTLIKKTCSIQNAIFFKTQLFRSLVYAHVKKYWCFLRRH